RLHHRIDAVLVTVIDGDTNRRVRGARVRVGRHVVRTDHHGVARVPLGARRALVTVAAKPGYGERAVRLAFRTHPQSTIRIFRSAAQWTMYGAVPARTQTQSQIRVRPPFRVVWSRGLGTHRVRWRRSTGCKITSSVAARGRTLYLGDYCGRLLALDARNGRVRWARQVGGRVYGTPAVAAGRVFAPSSTGGSLTAFSTRGRFLWRR